MAKPRERGWEEQAVHIYQASFVCWKLGRCFILFHLILLAAPKADVSVPIFIHKTTEVCVCMGGGLQGGQLDRSPLAVEGEGWNSDLDPSSSKK